MQDRPLSAIPTSWLAQVADAARRTGDLVLQHYQQGDFEINEKSDHSPVTSADIAASKLLTEQLQLIDSQLPILSEEAIVPWQTRRQWRHYWLIDPIDGTQEFIRGSGDFAISIALVSDFMPVLGAIFWPTEQQLFVGVKGQQSWREHSLQGQLRRQSIGVREVPEPATDPLTIAISRRQAEAKVLSRISPSRQIDTLMTGSCSLKSCLVAEGKADCFLRLGPTGEWDTGAAQVIIEQAGGSLVSEHFQPVTYNRTASLSNPNFLVLGDPRIDWPSVFPLPA